MSAPPTAPHDPTVNAVPTRPPLAVTPDVPDTDDLARLRQRFAPIFERIAAGAAERDVNRTCRTSRSASSTPPASPPCAFPGLTGDRR